MDEDAVLAQTFEGHRAHLHAVAVRLVGSAAEADDAVQEAWLRLSRSGAAGIDNLAGWLTTVVARVCLDMLRARRSRGEVPVTAVPSAAPGDADRGQPEQEALLADAVGLALLVVLDTLTSAERLAFVLHDMFAVPFDDIATILGRSPTAARQLASRARRRVQSPGTDVEVDRRRQRDVVEAFLAASRQGDFERLVELLDPGAVVRADEAAVAMGSSREVRGGPTVAGTFAGRARAAQLALLDGYAGGVWAPGGRPRVVLGFTVERGKVVEIELIADPEQLDRLDLVLPAG